MEQGKKIHSKYSKLNKIFPLIFLLALNAFILFGTRDMVIIMPYLIQFLILASIVPGYILFIKPILSAADEVYDHGRYLLVKKNQDHVKINLDEIINIRYPVSQYHQSLAALKINKNTKFGDEILFMPRDKLFKPNKNYKNEVIDDLIMRIDKAKRNHDS